MSCYLWGFGCMRDVPVKCLLHYWTQKNSIFIANWIIWVTKRENCLLGYSDEIISFKTCILLSPPSLSKWKLSQYLHEPMNERSPDSFPCWRHLSKTKLNHVTLLLKNAHWLPMEWAMPTEWSLSVLALLFIIGPLILILPTLPFMLLGYSKLS